MHCFVMKRDARDQIRGNEALANRRVEREVDQRLVHLADDANVAILSLGEKLRNKLRISNKAKELLELRRGDEEIEELQRRVEHLQHLVLAGLAHSRRARLYDVDQVEIRLL